MIISHFYKTPNLMNKAFIDDKVDFHDLLASFIKNTKNTQMK